MELDVTKIEFSIELDVSKIKFSPNTDVKWNSTLVKSSTALGKLTNVMKELYYRRILLFSPIHLWTLAGHWLICVYEVLGMYYHKPWPITIEKVLEIQKTNTYWYSRFISGIYKNDISGGFR